MFVVRAPWVSNVESTVCCATPSAFFSFWTPSAVVTISSSCIAVGVSTKFSVIDARSAATFVVFAAKPMRRAVTASVIPLVIRAAGIVNDVVALGVGQRAGANRGDAHADTGERRAAFGRHLPRERRVLLGE